MFSSEQTDKGEGDMGEGEKVSLASFKALPPPFGHLVWSLGSLVCDPLRNLVLTAVTLTQGRLGFSGDWFFFSLRINITLSL